MNNNESVNATFDQGLINTVAGDGTAGYNGDGIAATNAELNEPYGAAADGAGNIYIVDSGNQRIRKVTASTGMISTVAGDGTAGYSGDGEAAISAELHSPQGVAVDNAGNIYIADTRNNVIRVVNTGAAQITIAAIVIPAGDIATVAGDGYGSGFGGGAGGYSGDGGAATNAELNVPRSVAVDSAGNIYIADTRNNRIRKVTASTGIISTVAGDGPEYPATCGYGGDGGLATSAGLCVPDGVAVDSAGNVYIGDTGNNRIRVVNTGRAQITIATIVIPAGDIATVAGDGTGGYNGDGMAAISAELWGPECVAVDSAGNIYIADQENVRIRKVTAPTGDISTVAGNGTTGYNGDGMAATGAELAAPVGVAVDSAGNIYISENFTGGGERIRAVGP